MSSSLHRPRVLFIGPLPPPVHGVTLCLQNLWNHRAELPVEMVHLDSRFTDNHAELGKFSLRKLWLLGKYLMQLAKLLCFGEIKLVVTTPTFYFKPFLKDSLFIWLSWLLRKPVVAWIHNDFRFLIQNVRGLKLAYVKLTLRRLQKLILVSPKLLKFAPDWIEPSRLTSILNGVAVPPTVRTAERPPSEPFCFVYLSQMNEAKGWKTLLEAVKLLADQGQFPEVRFYGKPAFETTSEELETTFAQAQSAGLNVTWHGPVYDNAKWQALAAGDAMVFPSWHEAFPLAVLDAMAVGLSIVATDVGGVVDALTDGVGGFIVPPQDAPRLAEAMGTLIAAPEQALKMAVVNRQRYLAEFTDAAFAKRWGAFLGASLALPAAS